MFNIIALFSYFGALFWLQGYLLNTVFSTELDAMRKAQFVSDQPIDEM